MTRTTAALVISMLSLTLGACAGRVGFLKPGVSHQQFLQDYVACERYSGQTIAIGDDVGTSLLASHILTQGRINRCMQAMGYDVSRGNGGYR
jgi:hypothetical protein